MKKRIDIWYADDGHIVAWGYGAHQQIQAEPLATKGQSVLTADVEEQDLENLHLTHHVDASGAELRRLKP